MPTGARHGLPQDRRIGFAEGADIAARVLTEPGHEGKIFRHAKLILDTPDTPIRDFVAAEQAVEHAAASGAYRPGQVTYAGWVPGPAPTGPFPVVAPAGWQPDPRGQHQFRWWDGARWTEQTWRQAPTAPGPAL